MPKGVVDARCGRLVLFVMVDSVCSKLVRGVSVLFLISDQVRSIASWNSSGVPKAIRDGSIFMLTNLTSGS